MENGDNTTTVEPAPAAVNGTSEKHSSSSHKSEHKDKHRDKDKDRHRSDKDKHRHSSSKSSHKDKDRSSSSHSHRDKDKEREGHGDKDKEHKSSSQSSSRDKEKHSSSSKDKHSSSSSHKDKDGSSRDKDKHSSSSSKDKDRHVSSKDRDKHSSSSSHKDKDKHSSSSSSRDKDKHSKDSSTSNGRDKDKDRHRDKDKERSHKDKDRHSSSHKDKDRHKSSHSSSHKDHSPSKEHKRDEKVEVPIVKVEIKDEPPVEEEEESLVIDQQEEESSRDPLDTTADTTVKEEEESEDETPLSMRDTPKREREEDSEEDVPLTARAKKIKRESGSSKKKRQRDESSDEEEDYKPKKKPNKNKKPVKNEPSPRKGKPKQEEEEVWKWWEEKKKDDGTKWSFLEHKGPVFAPEYERLPSHVKFYYDGKEMRLSQDAEEVATFYSKMLNHDYTTKDVFNTNFMKDWRKTMNEKEKAIIKDLSKCNFKKMHEWFNEKSEERKARSKEEKNREKEENAAIQKEYGICIIDGHKEKIGNFRIEPPGLFRGRGEHPKMGMLKKRVMPEEVQINCSKDSKIPEPPAGHKWKKVNHDNQVTWLASWIENVQGNVKYVMLNPSSKLKGEKDMMKYEMARKLAKKVKHIRENYIAEWKSKEMRIRQRAVALYFIDRLALRAGNEKDEDQADTVGCCSLRVEHVQLKDHLNGKDSVVIFDFLGKDSIRYYNEVPVENRVYKNLKLFMENKKPGDDLFDRLNTSVLNKHLSELMEGLTAKVFRTYNASITLQNQLNELTNEDDSIPEKILAYNRANRAVAILCNHQRAVPKSYEKSMENLQQKIADKQGDIDEAKAELKQAKRNGDKSAQEKADKKLKRLKEQMVKMTIQETDRQENKTIALGTSKLNYLDPRISVAWCKKFDVPIEKIYNKTQRDKFRWAIDMAGPDYVF